MEIVFALYLIFTTTPSTTGAIDRVATYDTKGECMIIREELMKNRLMNTVYTCAPVPKQ
jgi:hypothetical protein